MKTILITGASRGIGKEIAIEFAKKGYNIVLNYNNTKVEDLIKQIENLGVKVLPCKADMSKFNEIKQMVDSAIKTFGKIDVLVNNAGVSLTKLIQDCTQEEIEHVIAVNTIGVINMCKLVTPNMISEKAGRIINISSIWGEVGACIESVYSASKGAVISFTKALAKELSPSNINVNCVCPGVIDTDMLNEYSQQDKNELKNQTPLNRLGTPKDVANAVCFLASEEASFITGQVITIDGGFIL